MNKLKRHRLLVEKRSIASKEILEPAERARLRIINAMLHPLNKRSARLTPEQENKMVKLALEILSKQ